METSKFGEIEKRDLAEGYGFVIFLNKLNTYIENRDLPFKVSVDFLDYKSDIKEFHKSLLEDNFLDGATKEEIEIYNFMWKSTT